MGPHELTMLASALEPNGIIPLHLARGNDGLWRATFETAREHAEPATNIAGLLAAIEALPPLAAIDWRACTLREFNVGYDCGSGPWAFNQALSPQLLDRMASAGVGLRITIYPEADGDPKRRPAA
jgi:hypothetical protein